MSAVPTMAPETYVALFQRSPMPITTAPVRQRHLPCWHVTATNGLIYGVAAHTSHEAKAILQSRLIHDAHDAREAAATPVRAENVGPWDATYGTTLCYGDA